MRKPTQNDQVERERWLSFVQAISPQTHSETLQLMERLRLVSHALYRVAESSVADTELSFAKYRLLLLLLRSEHEGRAALNPSELSRRQGTSRNTISALIRTLEHDGLVERHLDQTDRRKFQIRLTDFGRTLVQQHAQRHIQIMSNCFGGLTIPEQATLNQLLEKLGRRVGGQCQTGKD